MMIPTAYGRKGDILYIHGSTKNFMLNQILNGQTICIGVTHLDGIVLAKTLFDTSANYRSAILFGKASLVESEEEKMEGLKIITEHIIKGRWTEVPVGTDNELNATLVIRFTIERASAKIRGGGPQGDEDKESQVWSGHIPLSLMALAPVIDQKIDQNIEQSQSVKDFLTKFS
ncbi:MAG: pyridoxamine 5'-phosphate oxidase family protein [Flavobacteriaceae bacterium]|nr:pyridoxamine 5'-phosphate oxidase family protein [Flavobacteriaceae bacterium]